MSLSVTACIGLLSHRLPTSAGASAGGGTRGSPSERLRLSLPLLEVVTDPLLQLRREAVVAALARRLHVEFVEFRSKSQA